MSIIDAILTVEYVRLDIVRDIRLSIETMMIRYVEMCDNVKWCL